VVDEQAYDAEVNQRAEEVLTAAATRTRSSMWSVHANLHLQADPKDAADEVNEAVERTLYEVIAGGDDAKLGGPFHILPAMLLLCKWEQVMPSEAIAAIRRFFLEGVQARGNTENHWLMYYTGNLLAAERWHDEQQMWNGRSPEAMRREATRWILGTIERTARIGHHEYDSPGYHVEHMAPLIGLYEHTKDDHLRQQVQRVLILKVADMALEYFKGSWAGSHSREGYRQNTWTRVGPIQTLQYLYFGGEPFDADHHIHHFATPALVSAFRPPAMFAQMAWDRSEPHLVRKTKAPRNIVRHAPQQADPVYKSTFMSRSFALGSAQINLPGTAAGPIDLVSWDLTWAAPKHEGKICCNHPFQGPERFSAFLGPHPLNARRAIGCDKPYLQSVDRLFGASPFERILQKDGAILILYRIPEDDEAPFVNLYLPGGTQWVERDGWLFGNQSEFFVAVCPIGSWHWERIREARNDAIMVTNGDLIDGWLLRIDDPHAALALEAVEATDVESFEAFCDRRAGLDVDLTEWPDGDRIQMRTLQDSQLDITYNGDHRIDGDLVDYRTWPLYEGAGGTHAEVETGRMRFVHGEDVVDVDFGLDPDSELIPMRVIG